MKKELIETEAKKRFTRKGYTRDAFIAGAEWAAEVCEKGWIDANTCKPEVGELVLALTGSGSPSVMRYNGSAFVRSYSMNAKMRDGGSTEIKYEQIFKNIVSWMPLPKLNLL
jgi:hypothetical protein